MEFFELKSKSISELCEILREELRNSMVLRFKKASKDLTNTSTIKKSRRKIARIITALNQLKSS